jgi:CheY-like chemotaxis protein
MNITVSIYEASSGLKAIDFLNKNKIHRRPPSLIILDYNMPGMNGIESYKEIRKDPLLDSIPIVLLTTFFNERDIAYWHNEKCGNFHKASRFC